MALSSISVDFHRDNSPSLSPLSPTVIHYHQKYKTRKFFQHNHREFERHSRIQKQQSRNISLRQYYHKSKINKITKRRQSSYLWEEHKSSNGRIYYYNTITDQSQWEKPSREQLSSSSSIRKKSINKYHIHSKRSSNNNNEYYSKTSNLISISNDSINSTHSQSSYLNKKSSIYQRSFNKNDLNKSMTINNQKKYYKRKNDYIDVKSSFKKLRNNKIKTDNIALLTPTSPPANEIIQIDHVDPLPTSNNSLTNISFPFSNLSKQYHYQLLSTSLLENIFKLLYRKSSIKTQINQNLSSSFIYQSSLGPSSSTINAILQLEHSPSSILPIQYESSSIINSNSNDITRYYRGDLIQHLLNWPSTQIERETIRLSNEQIRYITYRLASLRMDLFSIRLQLERNRFQLLKYHHILAAQQYVISKLQLIDSNEI